MLMTNEEAEEIRSCLNTIIAECEEMRPTAENNVVEAPPNISTIVERAQRAKELLEFIMNPDASVCGACGGRGWNPCALGGDPIPCAACTTPYGGQR